MKARLVHSHHLCKEGGHIPVCFPKGECHQMNWLSRTAMLLCSRLVFSTEADPYQSKHYQQETKYILCEWMKYQQAYYSLVDRAVQCTLITTCQYFGHWRHLSVAEFCEGVQVGGCEGMIPHVCVHCRAIEKWPFWIPGSNNARLMDERKKQQQCKKNTITQDSETPPCGQLGMSASSKKKKNLTRQHVFF